MLLLTELQPRFLKRIDDHHFRKVDTLNDADGIIFLCPKCFEDGSKSSIGCHSIICWNPSVPQSTTPVPGRWNMTGTGFNDLTLIAGSSSILLTDGCKAHFFIRDGQIINT